MNMTWSLLWALLCAVLLAPLSRADVCQKNGGTVRIKISALPNGTLSFKACNMDGKDCTFIGPEGKSFTYGELAKKRNELDDLIVRNKTVDVAGGLFTVLLLPGFHISEAGEAASASNHARAIATEAKANIKTLKPAALSTSSKCTEVDSVADHQARLGMLLTEIDEARLKTAAVARHKIEEKPGAKSVPAAPGDVARKAPAPAPNVPAQ